MTEQSASPEVAICRSAFHRATFWCSLLYVILLAGCGAATSTTGVAAPPTAPAPPVSPPPAGATAAPAVAPVPSSDAEAPRLPVTVTDYQGQQVAIDSIERIVSLNGDITEIIFALGMGDRVVGVDSSSTYPREKTRELPNIGYQRRLNAEGILALTPTLVIGDETAGPPEALAQIRSAGVPVALTADPPDLTAPLVKIRFVAAALGVPERGEMLAAQVEREIATARAAARELPASPRVLFLYLRGTDVQQVAGSETPADAMIRGAGGANAAAEAGIVQFKPLSPEVVVASQPDVILLLAKGLESVGGVEGLLRIPGLADTPAARHQHIVAMDDLYLLGLGPRTGQALADLTIAFRAAMLQEAGR